MLDESPVAWDFGPDFPSLYANIKKSGQLHIKTKLPNALNHEVVSDEDRKFLDKIWSIYGKYDGVYLSALTHQKGTPWKEVCRKNGNAILQGDSIYEHYKDNAHHHHDRQCHRNRPDLLSRSFQRQV